MLKRNALFFLLITGAVWAAEAPVFDYGRPEGPVEACYFALRNTTHKNDYSWLIKKIVVLKTAGSVRLARWCNDLTVDPEVEQVDEMGESYKPSRVLKYEIVNKHVLERKRFVANKRDIVLTAREEMDWGGIGCRYFLVRKINNEWKIVDEDGWECEEPAPFLTFPRDENIDRFYDALAWQDMEYLHQLVGETPEPALQNHLQKATSPNSYKVLRHMFFPSIHQRESALVLVQETHGEETAIRLIELKRHTDDEGGVWRLKWTEEIYRERRCFE